MQIRKYFRYILNNQLGISIFDSLNKCNMLDEEKKN